jgi:hypothetical protein
VSISSVSSATIAKSAAAQSTAAQSTDNSAKAQLERDGRTASTEQAQAVEQSAERAAAVAEKAATGTLGTTVDMYL